MYAGATSSLLSRSSLVGRVTSPLNCGRRLSGRVSSPPAGFSESSRAPAASAAAATSENTGPEVHDMARRLRACLKERGNAGPLAVWPHHNPWADGLDER